MASSKENASDRTPTASLSLGSFHYFSKLPAEIRQAIWRECLPRSVCELDSPDPTMIYEVDNAPGQFVDGESDGGEPDDGSTKPPCTLLHTTMVNARPPAITRICRESRAVAFKAGEAAARNRETTPRDAHWASPTTLDWINDWKDRVPDIVHMYWTLQYDPIYTINHSDERPINNLASVASCAGGRAAIMVQRLADAFWWETPEHYCAVHDDDDTCEEPDPVVREPTPEERTLISSFMRLRSYLVVLEVVVAHTDWKTGAASGLFGLLGDAPVQIIDMSDDARINAYYKFAEDASRASGLSPTRRFRRRSLDLAKHKLRNLIVEAYGSDELVPLMRPAIMFRLCTLKYEKS